MEHNLPHVSYHVYGVRPDPRVVHEAVHGAHPDITSVHIHRFSDVHGQTCCSEGLRTASPVAVTPDARTKFDVMLRQYLMLCLPQPTEKPKWCDSCAEGPAHLTGRSLHWGPM